jgi:hypothetical protein
MGKYKKGKGTVAKTQKSRDERRTESVNIRSQIFSLGLGDGNPDVMKFLVELERFVETGEAWTGNIKLHGHHRVINAILTTRPSVVSSVSLIYQKDV